MRNKSAEWKGSEIEKVRKKEAVVCCSVRRKMRNSVVSLPSSVKEGNVSRVTREDSTIAHLDSNNN